MAQDTLRNSNMQISRLFQNFVKFFREKKKSLGNLSRRKRARFRQIEMLEARHMMVAAIWHNVLQPLNVSGEPGGSVDPLDVLTVINEINNPKYSDRGALIQDVPAGQSLPYFDVNCNSTVDPLDVLSIINAINSGVYDPSWNFEASQNTTGKKGRVTISACSPKLIEGDSLSTELNQTIVLPDDTSAVRVSFEAPVFDTLSRDAIRDAFEIVLLDPSGQPLSLPYGANRDAIYNWSESIEPVVGPAAKTTTLPAGSISTATFNLTGLPAGTPIQVVVRLVNDDTDTNSSVVIRRVEIVDIAELAPTGMSVPASDRPAFVPVDPNLLTDVSPNVKPIYGRTTLVDDKDIVVTDLQMINQGSNALSGRIVVAIDNLSDPNIGVMHPDGFLPGGRPYFVLNGTNASGWLAPNDKTNIREVRFSNPQSQQFSYSLKTLAELNAPPTDFSSLPLREIEAGKSYRYLAQATDPDNQTLVYSIVAGPTGMTIDPSSGQVAWPTASSDIGNQSIVLQASDPYGLSVQQTFTIAVVASLQNRPPIFTSNPPTDATVAGAWEITTLASGKTPSGLTFGDFGNGKTSVVTTNQGDQTISVIPGDGVGQASNTNTFLVGEQKPSGRLFRSGTSVNVGLPSTLPNGDSQSIDQIAQGDLNGDGAIDLVASSRTKVFNRITSANNTYSNFLSVVLNHGDGSFEDPIFLPVINPTTDSGVENFGVGSVNLVDFDGDGTIDILALYGNGGTSGPNLLLFWKGLGKGAFAPLAKTETGTYLSSFQIADFNGDGKLDLMAIRTSQNQAGVMLGNGDGTFGVYSEFANISNSGYGGLNSVGDIDGKNGPDVVLASYFRQQIDVFLNDGTGHLVQSRSLNTGGTGGNGQTFGATIGDFTRDGKADILFWTWSSSDGGGVGIYKGTGDGSNFTYANAKSGNASYVAQIPYNNTLKPIDLNGDGNLDIYLGHSGGEHGIDVGLGKGDGTFDFTTYEQAFDPTGASGNNTNDYSVLAGDYNGDGFIDLAALSVRYGGADVLSKVTILYADSPGVFAAPKRQITTDRRSYGAGPGISLFGDVNNDGIVDIVAGNQSGFYTSFGKGEGTFGPALIGLRGYNSVSDGFLFDLNQDGKLDLVWTGGLNGANVNAGYGAALGNGDGTFAFTFAQSAGNFYGAGVITPGDFNGDGYTDFASFHPAINAPGTGTFLDGFHDVFLYQPSAPGTFLRSYHNVIPVSIVDDNLRRSFAAADFDGDGVLDLLSVLGKLNNNPMQLLFFHGLGNGTFSDPISTPILTSNTDALFPKWIAVGDLNEDGKLDFVLTSAYSRASIFLGRGDGSFDPPTDYVTGTGSNSRHVYLNDIDRDGHLDLIGISENYYREKSVTVRAGNGDGTVDLEQVVTLSGTNYLNLADYDGDGVTDLISSNDIYGGGYSVLLNGTKPGLSAVASGDLDGDRKLDLIATNFANSHLKLLRGKGDNTFQRQPDLIVGRGPIALAARDFTGDGKLDLVTANRSGRSVTLLANDGNDRYVRTDIPVGMSPVAMAVGDLNTDGIADLLIADDSTNAAYLLLGNGRGFYTPVPIPLGDQPNAVTIADATGDGKLDAVLSLPNSKRIMIMPGNGNGTFDTPMYVVLTSSAGGVTAGDFNQDGATDLAVTLPSEGVAAVLYGRGSGLFARPQSIRVGTQPTTIVAQDTDNDGRIDLLVTNAGDATASVILNKYDPTQLYQYTVTATDPDGDPVSFDLSNGPGGMILNSSTGQIVWAPTSDQIGTNGVTIQVSDGRGGIATQTFQIGVAPKQTNTSPVIVTAPQVTLDASQPLRYSARAVDSDHDSIRYRLVSGPDSASIDPITGKLEWDPRESALQFDNGTSRYASPVVIVADRPALRTASLTLEGWFRVDSSTENQSFIYKQGPNGNFYDPNSYALRFQSGYLLAQVGGIAKSERAYAQTGYAWKPDVGHWYHLAMSFDDTLGVLTLYLDGRAVSNTTTNLHITYDTSDLQFGSYFRGGDRFVGAASQVRLWEIAQSQADIQANLVRDVASDTPGLVADYRFHDGDAQTVADSSINAIHGKRTTFNAEWPSATIGIARPQSQAFTIRAEDGRGGFDEQTFSVDVVPPYRNSLSGTITQRDNNAPLSGWTVFADSNGNGYRDSDEPFANTNVSGLYAINGLLTNTYAIAIEPRAGFVTPPNRSVTIKAFKNSVADFSITPLGLGQIRGAITSPDPSVARWDVYIDDNGNKVRDVDEETTTSDRLGNYVFASMAAGTYSVRLDAPSGWNTSLPTSGAYSVNLGASGSSTGNDFQVSLRDANDENRPRFVTVATPIAVARATYRYASRAADPLNRPIAYNLSNAPAGMVIDPDSGAVAWTPRINQLGNTTVIVRAVNDRGAVDLQSFNVDVIAPNSAPIITSLPTNDAFVGLAFRYDTFAQDAEQTTLSYELNSAPSGATIDAATGRIQWTPAITQLGSQRFNVIVRDGLGGQTNQSFNVLVSAAGANAPPLFDSVQRSSTRSNTNYFGLLHASDPDNDPLLYTLVSGPVGMTVSADGEILWKPTASQLGSNSVTVRANDGRGGTIDQSFAIEVGNGLLNNAPRIASIPPALATVNRPLIYHIRAIDADNDPLAFDLQSAPFGMSIDAVHGTVHWTPATDQLEPAQVSIRVRDPFGGETIQSFVISVRATGGPPAIISVPPTESAVGIGYLYSVTAIDAENDPLAYSLIQSPTGMTINAVTGEIAWTPTLDQVGQQQVVLQVGDGLGGFTTQGFLVAVLAGVPNKPPIVLSSPPKLASVGSSYSFTLSAMDPEGQAVTYQLRRSPDGMSVDASTGIVTWTPSSTQLGTTVVTVAAFDPAGAAGVLSYELNVLPANHAPQIVSQVPRNGTAGGAYRYDVKATDIDLDPLSFKLLSGPVGMTVDPFGRIRWPLSVADIGAHSGVVQVSDGRGGLANQSIEFTVIPDTTPPRVTVIPGQAVIRANSPEVFVQFNLPPFYPTAVVRASAIDDVGVTRFTVKANDKPIVLDSNGLANFNFKDWGFGVIRVTATAVDAAGNQGTGSASFEFKPFGDDPAVTHLAHPIAMITSPAVEGSVQGMVPITGTALSDNFVGYTLSYRRADSSEYKIIKTSTSRVQDGNLGTWDTTLLDNDQYFLRVEVEDDVYETTKYEMPLSVTGNFKLGNFRLSFTDITIPVAGIPITLARTYDTLRADRDSDFGYGWSLEFRNTNLRTNLPKTGLEQFGIYSAFNLDTKVYITLPGGQRKGFTFTPDIRVLPGFGLKSGLTVAYPRFTPDRGVTDTLTVRGGYLLVNEFGEMSVTGSTPWNPASPDFGGGFTLTTSEGIRYQIDGNSGKLTTATDRNGNAVSFSDDGISGRGVRITFDRDSRSRITKAIDPAGNSIKYAYSTRGDLVKVTDRTGKTTEFVYKSNSPHVLDKVVDPLGRTGIRTDYDDKGRLAATIDALGNSVRTSYDPENSMVTVRDALGNASGIEYDPRGNAVATTDALGGTTRLSYDANDFVLSETDPLGRTISYTRDSLGNELSRTDALGHTTFATYDAFGQQLSTTDALGRTAKNKYDIKGNAVATIDASGAMTVYANDDSGRMTSSRAPGGFSLSFGFENSAQPVSTTDWNGLTTTIAYSATGLPTKRSSRVQTDLGTVSATETTAYDAEGREISVTDAIGSTIRTEYDSAGQIAARIDAQGNKTTYVYDAAGNLIESIRPDGKRLLATYDANNRLITETDAAGRLTRYEYDSLGRETAVVFADLTPLDATDNPRKRTVYDAAGEVIAEIDEIGNRTEFHYDLARRRIEVVDALGNVSKYEYDPTGALLRTIDPLNRVSAILYDTYGRKIGDIARNGATNVQSLDERGLTISKTDSGGRTTSFAYTPGGQLAQVSDAIGNVTHYEYDTRGKLSTQSDANGHITRFEYDILGGETARILPGGQAWRKEYDSMGRVSRTIDPNGHTIDYAYDVLGQIATETRSDGQLFSYTYAPTGLIDTVTDPRGVTRYTYDARDRLVSRTEPDGQAIQFRYDDAGRTLSMTTLGGTVDYTYDANGRMTSVTDPNGKTTSYHYDSAGQLTMTNYANGVVERLEYDTNGRLIHKVANGPAGVLTDFRYTLDNTGRVVELTENGERVQYEYDADYRITREHVIGGQDVFYTYDAVGNRLSKTDATGSTSYEYDSNDRLLRSHSGSVLTLHTYDLAGNELSRQIGDDHTDYTWDDANRMIRAQTTHSGSTLTEQYRYNADGQRVATLDASGETRYLLNLNGQLSQVSVEYRPSGLLIVSYVRGVSLVGEVRDASSFMLTDRLGSVVAVVDAAGLVQARYSYDAFGNVISSSGTSGSQLRFVGEPQSRVSGLNDFRARWYDPSIGRFVSADPFVGVQADPNSRQRYLYANADPVNRTDPSGLFAGLGEFSIVNAIIRGFDNSFKISQVKRAYEYSKATLEVAQTATMIAYYFAEVVLSLGVAAPAAGLATAIGGTTSSATTFALTAVEVAAKKKDYLVQKLTFFGQVNKGATAAVFGAELALGFGAVTPKGQIKYTFGHGIEVTGALSLKKEIKKTVNGIDLVKLALVGQAGFKEGHKGVELFAKITLELSLYPAVKFSLDIAPGLFPSGH